MGVLTLNCNWFLVISVFLLIIFTPDLYAQKQGKARLDSLVQELSRRGDDTNKVKLLSAIAFQAKEIAPDEGLKFGFEELRLAETLNWEKGLGMAYSSLAINYEIKADYDKALEYNRKALNINEALGNKYGVASALGNIGNVYIAQSNYPDALASILKALKIEEEINNKQVIPICLLAIQNIYSQMKEDRKALDYGLLALKNFEALKDTQNIAICRQTLATIYDELGETQLGMECEKDALQLFQKIGLEVGAMACYVGEGDFYREENNFPMSLDCLFKALEMGKRVHSDEWETNALSSIGHTYLTIAKDTLDQLVKGKSMPTGKHAALLSAIRYLEQAKTKAEKIAVLSQLIKIQNMLSEAYNLTGNFKAALDNYKAASVLHDSVFSVDNKVDIAHLETKREAELKEKEMQINALATTRKWNERAIFSICVLLLFVTVGAIYKNASAQKRVNKIQRDALDAKEMLIKEVHHRVKNNLQVVSTLLSLQINSLSDSKAKQAIMESSSRLKAMSLIHHQLYQQDNITAIETAGFATKLYEQLNAIFNANHQNITFYNHIPTTTLDIDTAVPLGLILNELITNSYKYAFDGAKGAIEVGLEKEGSIYKLCYKDSGPGLPEGLNTTTLKTLGMLVINSLSKQIGGKFVYESENKMFIITFKDAATMKLAA